MLALEIRSKGLGFAIFYGPETLLNWGMCEAVPDKGDLLSQTIASLIDEASPSVIVIGTSGRPAGLATVRIISSAVRKQGLAIDHVSRQQVSAVFTGHNQNKHEIGLAISERFPELAAYIPPKRKPWNSEDYRTRVFDAVASGLTHFHLNA